MSERPRPSVSRLGGSAIRPLLADDQPFLKDLGRLPGNENLAPSDFLDEPDFVASTLSEPWSTPMVLVQDGKDVGAAMVGAVDTQHRHGRLIILARDPRAQGPVMALYLRQAFWGYPLHRLYAVVPTRLSPSYGELLRAGGFTHEGCLLQHLRSGGRLVDLDMYGLLRSEFDAWCRDHEPELAL